ncbi:unnamed protein product [Dicrocoelium dendriticum]|nr:unnamed protein product [Dicrocoelium dendriticum]
MLLGLTDSVHAIRFTAIPLVARLLDQLSLGTVQKFLDHIIELFNRQEVETWEVAEGLLNALGLLVKRMMPEAGHTHGSPTGMSSDTFEYHVLPRIKGLVYNLFDYEHPSVRSGAVQLLLTCLKRCQRTVSCDPHVIFI